MLAITHYARLLDELQPDVVHVLMGGRVVQTGGPELAQQLEETGYEGLAAELGVDVVVERPARRSLRRPRRLLSDHPDEGYELTAGRSTAQTMVRPGPVGMVVTRTRGPNPGSAEDSQPL